MTPREIFRAVAIVSATVTAFLFVPVLIPSAGPLSHAVFHHLCHQDPARTLTINGVLLPVCARCTGLYLGFLAGWIGWSFMPAERRDAPASSLLMIAGFAPLVVDGVLNAMGLVTTPAVLRLFTGLLFSAVAARALWPALVEAAQTLSELRRRSSRPRATPDKVMIDG